MSIQRGTTIMTTKIDALQDLAAPEGICFGCGPKNPRGLKIKSYWDEDDVHVVMKHVTDPSHAGWPGLVYGGLLGCLIDCHSNWAAIASHYRAENRQPGTLPRIECVTASLSVKYLKPTPMGVELLFKARVEGELGRKTRVLCEVYAGNTLTVVGDSVFVRVDAEQLARIAHGQLKRDEA